MVDPYMKISRFMLKERNNKHTHTKKKKEKEYFVGTEAAEDQTQGFTGDNLAI